jgi:SAM-dependent methyltransferase
MKKFKAERRSGMRERWNKRAKDYPRYRDETDGFEDRLINTVQEKGVELAGKRILDIGCGTGRYTIRLAKLAGEVTGNDISEEMLSILENDAAEEGLSNVSTILSGWENFDCGGGNDYEITFCTLTPAIKTEDNFSKMIDCASEHAVYLGWRDRRECEAVRKVYALYDITPMKFNSADLLLNWLKTTDCKHTHVPLTDVWSKTKSIEGMMERIIDDIKEYGAAPDTEAVREVLLSYSEDGKNITYITEVDLILIIVYK